MCGLCTSDDLINNLYTLRQRIWRLDAMAKNLSRDELLVELTKLTDEMYDL